MALDEATRTILEMMAAAGAPPVSSLGVSQVRSGAAGITALQTEAPDLAAIHDLTIPGPAGRLPVRVYVPHGEGPFPTVLFFYGGGWVTGDLEVVHRPVAKLAAEAGVIVVSASYRMAPETQFPGGIEDAVAAALWTARTLEEYGGDPTRLFIAGESSGANTATVVARRVRDLGGVALAGQILIYPVTDSQDSSYPSRVDNGEGYGLTRETMDYNWNHYLRSPEDRVHPDVAPIRGELAGLAPALVMTMEYDPLRDEGEAYAAKLEQAGVPVRLRRYAGLIHGTFAATAAIPRSQELYDDIADFIRHTPPSGDARVR